MAGPNLFQRTMQAWDEYLPYNAVHAVQVGLPMNRGALQGAIRASLGAFGFPLEADQIALAEHSAGASRGELLLEVMREQLNHRFDHSPTNSPFRFFTIDHGEDGFLLGVCYFHPVASADCICWLLTDIMAGLSGSGETLSPAEERLPPPGYRRLLLSHCTLLPRWLLALPLQLLRNRSYARPRGKKHAKPAIGLLALPLSRKQWDWIQSQRNETGATVHDVILTLVTGAIAEAIPRRLRHGHRRQVAVGSIVNIRKHFGPKHARTFGLFLGMFVVSHPVPEEISFRDLLADIRRQTAAIKRGRLYLGNLLQLGAALAWRRLLPPKRRSRLYLKNLPLAASVTNFFVDRSHELLTRQPAGEYWRGVSISPATPLVVSCTTFRDDMKITVSFDESIYSVDDVRGFAARVQCQIEKGLSANENVPSIPSIPCAR